MDMMFLLVLIFFGSPNDLCDGCEVGYYGESCSNVCPKNCHGNECNVKSGKCLSCVKGYYADQNQDCIPCREHCTACSSYSFCFACKYGFRGETCDDMCTNCKTDTSCDKNTGYCLENCSDGRSGELCDILCDSKCKSCRRYNKHECMSCADDENGNACKEECLNGCLRSSCEKSHRSCSYECLSGYQTDTACNRTCLSYCRDIVCNITCKELAPDKPSSSTSNGKLGLILGLVIGTIVIITVGITVILVVRRRGTTQNYCCYMSGDRRPNRKRKSTANDVEKNSLLLREAKIRTRETKEVQSAKKLTILEIQGTFSSIEQKYGLKITIAGNKVTVAGDQMDIEHAFKKVYAECEKIKQVPYKHFKSRDWVTFFNTEPTIEYCKKNLTDKKLLGSWDINDTELSVFVTDIRNSEKIKNTLLESIVEKLVRVDRSLTELFNSEWWSDFMLDIQKEFRDKVSIDKREQDVFIIGTDDVVPLVEKLIKGYLDAKPVVIPCEPLLCKFVSKYWTKDDFYKIRKSYVNIEAKANGFELRGLSENVNKSKQKLEKKLKGICSKQHVLTKTGIVAVLEAAKHSGNISDIEKECRCVVKLPEEINESLSVMLSDYEVIDFEILEEKQHDSSTDASPKCFQTKRNKIKIQLIQGEMDQQKARADIIVVGDASSLNLQSGSALVSLLKQDCPNLETDYNRHYPNGIKNGEVAVIDSGSFICDKIYLTSLPPWQEDKCFGAKLLRNFMRECLRLADKNGKKTIAFSSMVAGGDLDYPIDLAVRVMYGAVVEFDHSYSVTSLKEISILMSVEDKNTIKAFKKHEHMRIYGSCSVGSLSTDFSGGKIKIDLVTGDLLTQKVDAILCIISSDKTRTPSTSWESLLQKCGSSLQNEFKELANKPNVGTVTGISGGSLPCKTVFLTVLPSYTNSSSSEQSLITAIQNVFSSANSEGHQSLAIPALETGYLDYPKTASAKCMYDAAIGWANKNPTASLKVVYFVMCSKKSEAQQIYRMCHLKKKHREARAKRKNGAIYQESKYKIVIDGCAIGPIKLQVQIGDLVDNTADAVVYGVSAEFDIKGDIAQALMEKCPDIIRECNNKKNDLKKDGVAITTIAGLNEKHVIYVRLQDSLGDWRSKIVTCLEAADIVKTSITSVAFPVLGSGVGLKTSPANCIGECLFAAIDDFTSQNPKSSVTDVNLVVPESDAGCVPAIIAALKDRTTALNSQWGIGKIFKSHYGFRDEKLECGQQENVQQNNLSNESKDSSVTVYVFSDSGINIDNCIKAMDDRIGLEYATKEVDVDEDIISQLKDIQIDSIIDSYMKVDVTSDKNAGKITIVGPLPNVLAAAACLHNKMLECKLDGNKYSQTKWHWRCEERFSMEKEVPYDETSNYTIESAYRNGIQTVQLQYDDGNIYVIDFQELVEYPKVNSKDTVRLIRKNILKGDSVNLPTTWTIRSNVENAKWVELNKDGNEYKKVKKKFLKGYTNGEYAKKAKKNRSVNVNKIDRIENVTLYEQYATTKQLMAKRNPGCKDIERILWHGTPDKSILRIENQGFNRSYCGVKEVTYGQGVYFAADASYAVHSIAENKPRANRYMFLAEVLTGKLIKGNPSMRFPVDPAQPTVMYDSAVDDVNNPKQFVIFHDKQAYPKYLITYTLT